MAKRNLEMLRIAVENLGPLASELVFIGGCMTGLLITDEGAPEPRETKDVDGILEAASYAEYLTFSEKLKAQGFREDTADGAPLCRWVKQGTVLDVMPLDGKILGFTNRWYRHAIETACEWELSIGISIRVISSTCFCATKMDAFDGRGKADFMASHDLEDVISVIDGRAELAAEIEMAPSDLRSFIAGKVGQWLETESFLDALPGHLGADQAAQGRIGMLLERLNRIAGLAKPTV
jgi:hypothetical protein